MQRRDCVDAIVKMPGVDMVPSKRAVPLLKSLLITAGSDTKGADPHCSL